MSILINMEMPKGCVSCFLKCGSCSSIRKRIDESRGDKWCPVNYRHPDCPLIEVPEHGRLIDADRLGFAMMDAANADQALAMVDDAPTVIPADKDGET